MRSYLTTKAIIWTQANKSRVYLKGAGTSDIQRLAGALVTTAGLVFFLFNTVAEGIYPDYSVGADPLSNLGGFGTNTFVLWNAQLFVTGLLVVSGMWALFYRSQFRPSAGRTVRILYVLPGVGAMIVSLFPIHSALNASFITGGLYQLGILHGIGAIFVFIPGAVMAIYSYKLTRRPFGYLSVSLGVIALAFFPLQFASGAYSGLYERLAVYPYLLWLIGFGTYLMSNTNSVDNSVSSF